MARRPSQTEAPKEENVSTTTEAPVEPTTTEAPAAEEKPVDLTDFLAAAEAAVETRDETTGVVPTANLEPVIIEYRKLDGIKAKNAGKKVINEKMTEGMKALNLPLARAYMDVQNSLTAGNVPAEHKAREPKAPVDPTEAFVDLVAGLELARALVAAPEGVAEDWPEKVDTKVTESRDAADAYRAWLLNEAEDKGDAPETAPFVVAAVKLSLGKSAKVGKSKAKSERSGDGYSGPHRDIAKHIAEAFADVPSGTFLAVSEIRKFNSSEYGADLPSPGAISARLFPKSGKVTIEGVRPDTNEKGVKGAVKL